MSSLRTTNDIVKYLKEKDLDYSNTARSDLYNSFGLNKRLGLYAGSSNQNQAIMRRLNKVSIHPMMLASNKRRKNIYG